MWQMRQDWEIERMKAEITDIIKEQDKVTLTLECCCTPGYDSYGIVSSSNLLMALYTQWTIDMDNLHLGEAELKQEPI